MLCATEDRLNFAHFLQAVKHSLLFVLSSRLLAEHYFLHPAHPCRAHCGPHKGHLLCLLEEVEYNPTHRCKQGRLCTLLPWRPQENMQIPLRKARKEAQSLLLRCQHLPPHVTAKRIVSKNSRRIKHLTKSRQINPSATQQNRS